LCGGWFRFIGVAPPRKDTKMHSTIKEAIILHLDEAFHILSGVVDKSLDELYLLDEIGDALSHIKDIDADEL